MVRQSYSLNGHITDLEKYDKYHFIATLSIFISGLAIFSLLLSAVTIINKVENVSLDIEQRSSMFKANSESSWIQMMELQNSDSSVLIENISFRVKKNIDSVNKCNREFIYN